LKIEQKGLGYQGKDVQFCSVIYVFHYSSGRRRATSFFTPSRVTLFSPLETKADDFLIGTRGPTPIQFDHGINYTRRETAQGVSDNWIQSNVVKFWTGKELGFFAIGALPYKFLGANGAESSGLGDLTLKLGPRGTFDLGKQGSFHWITAAGASFPVGDATTRPALGTGRYDFKGGFTTTWLDTAKKNEVTTAFEYTKPVALYQDRNASDELNTGFILGSKLNETWRVGAGLRGILKVGEPSDGDYILKARALARYTFPHNKMWHLELITDKSIATKNMSDETMGAVLVRYNFKP